MDKPTKKKRVFVLCPICGARSKKLSSEFGGLETRQCTGGCVFKVDTWMMKRVRLLSANQLTISLQ